MIFLFLSSSAYNQYERSRPSLQIDNKLAAECIHVYQDNVKML